MEGPGTLPDWYYCSYCHPLLQPLMATLGENLALCGGLCLSEPGTHTQIFSEQHTQVAMDLRGIIIFILQPLW